MGARCIAYCEALYHDPAYIQLPLRSHGKTRPSPWSKAHALAVLKLWWEEEKRLPCYRECCRMFGLPAHSQIEELFGSRMAWAKHAGIDMGEKVLTAKALLTVPVLPPDTMAEVKRRALLTQRYPKQVTCLRCDQRWYSPDARRYRICPSCHKNEDGLDSSGEWMNGTPLQDVGSLDYAEEYL